MGHGRWSSAEEARGRVILVASKSGEIVGYSEVRSLSDSDEESFSVKFSLD